MAGPKWFIAEEDGFSQSIHENIMVGFTSPKTNDRTDLLLHLSVARIFIGHRVRRAQGIQLCPLIFGCHFPAPVTWSSSLITPHDWSIPVSITCKPQYWVFSNFFGQSTHLIFY